MLSGPLPELIRSLRTANKILNIWVDRYLPEIAAKMQAEKSRRDRIWADVDQNVYLYNKAQEKVRQAETDLQQIKTLLLLDKLTLSWDSPIDQMPELQGEPQQALEQKGIQLAMYKAGVMRFAFQRDAMIQELGRSTGVFGIDPYVLSQERNDDDIVLEHMDDVAVLSNAQIAVLKKVKKQIAQVTHDTADQLVAVCHLVKKYSTIFTLNQNAITQNQDLQVLQQWAKLGLWLLEKHDEFAALPVQAQNKHVQFFLSFYNSNILITGMMYSVMASLYAKKTTASDFDLFLAEQYLQNSEEVFKRQPAHLINNARTGLNIPALQKCTHARIAYAKSDFKQFLTVTDDIERSYSSTAFFLQVYEMFILRGDYHSRNNQSLQALHYYEKAFVMVDNNRHNPEYYVESKRSLTNKIQDAKLSVLRDALPNKIPQGIHVEFVTEQAAIIQINSINNPLNKKALNRVLKALQIEEILFGGTHTPTRITLTINSFNFEEIQRDFNRIISKLSPPIVAVPWVATAESSSAAAVPVSPTPPEAPASPGQTVSADEVSASSVKQAAKSRPASLLVHDSSVTRVQEGAKSRTASMPTSPRDKVCHASDFGFTDPKFKNNTVTPIYSSLQAQKHKRPQLFVTWDQVDGLDKVTEKQFQGMLNPTQEGVVTVGMVNQPGFKLWKHPDNLQGEGWRLCALRLKRKGHGAGMFRLITDPIEKITVKGETGNMENRYLFSLGKPKHK